MNLHETAQGRRIPDTSNWFLKSPPVQSWLQRIGPNVPSSHCNIISFQGKSPRHETYLETAPDETAGKPGYGKTTLCSALIGYLSSDYESSTSTPTSRNVVFFYFDKQSGQAREASHALRAILAQLLQIHGGSDRGIDIASLLWYQARSGQHVASENEAKELLSLICSQTDQLVLVLDGIDECTNEKELFTSLDHVGFTSSNHSIAFFGRPTVPLPKRMSTRAQKIMLSNEQNSGDIRRYLRCKVNDMIDDDVLPENLNGEKTVEKIAVRANGMFLWVTLLVEYLYLASPALTMSQRRHTIDNLTRLEGLDALYGAIIESILAKYSGEARQNIQHLFQWVVCSSRPLLVSELSCAIAVPRDRKLEDDDSFGDLSLSLSRLSGALLEISPTKVVRFIHLSALEYFKDWSLPITDGKTSATQHQHSFVSFCGPDAYIYCSVVCLSYIYHTVGAGPLSGSTQMSLDSTALEKRYPFLKYVSEFLFPHMLKAITVVESDISTLDLGRFIPLLDLARLFLSSKDSITTWIEICWTFGRKPQVVNGEDQIAKILENLTLDRRFMEPFGHCIESLSKLAEDLHHLNKQWSKVLAQSPNEIWEPSISAFLKSDLWVSVDGSRLIPLDSGVNESDFVVVKSRVSADGTKLAIIKVQPPVPGVTYSNSKWMVRHTILSLKSMEMEIQTSFHIPSSMVPFSHIWEHKTDSEGDKPILEFIFPTTISSDLQHATFLNLAGSLVNQDVLISSGSTKILKTRPKMLLQVINTSLQTDPDVCGSFNFDWSTFHNGFWSHMSESGEFLLVLHVLPADVAKQIDKSADIPRAKVWFVRVYRNEAFSEQRGPSFTLLSAIAFVPDQITELKDRPFTFHPELPLLVFASGRTAWIERTDGEMGFSILRIRDTGSEAITLIWNFALKGILHPNCCWICKTNARDAGSKPLNIGSLMRDVSFSNDGTNLYGTADSKKIMVEVPFDKMGIHGPPEVAGESKALVISSQQVSLNSSGAIAALSNGPSPMTQDPNSLVFGQDAQGETVVTDLRQSHEHGALVLRTLRDQTMTQETLTRLPSWVDEGFEATLLNRTRENGHHPDGVVRVMLNRAARPFEKYKSSDSSNVPTLLERDLQTVPRFTVQADHLLGDAETTKQRLRLK